LFNTILDTCCASTVFSSVHIILAIATCSDKFSADRAYACTYAHMYAAICVYIPVPVPVQWAVIRGTNEKETM